ncbi:6-hydroxymethylpterin diphosphokinase MptE-like protein [Thalassotalea sp. G2M2-11]|uniref:motility associated factor glycosyltransferase family protein n=1 Tax=Thalassotalea sp. G2M2-11 TaxID=2787627 RepID=UPI0019D10692|nr:6-hydroxymethylpterin diphosphokinase MptE-like protein [Thalassotalea sp. G2M2-11]
MTSSILEANLAIILRRWPSIYQQLTTADLSNYSVETDNNTLIINDIQLTSNYEREKEAQLQAQRIPQDSTKAFIYGPGLGDTCNLLLERKHLKNLHVITLNPVIFLHVLNSIDNTRWLNNKKTHLHCAPLFNELHSPFLANPSELVLASDENAQLRDRIELELNNENIKLQFTKDEIQEKILANIDYIEKDPDITKYNIESIDEIFIAAAGPTLEYHLDWLRKNPRYIICVDAALKTILNAGITPNIVISIDKHVFHFFDDIPYKKICHIPLLYFPSVDRRLLEYWKGPRICSYSQTPMFSKIKKLKKLTPLFCAGSVIHPAIDFAVKLGAKSIILLGADFSYPNNKSHAGTYSPPKSFIDVSIVNHWIFNYLGEKQPTQANFKGYARDLEKYIAEHPEISFLNGSEQSAKIEGVPLWIK